MSRGWWLSLDLMKLMALGRVTKGSPTITKAGLREGLLYSIVLFEKRSAMTKLVAVPGMIRF